MRKYYFLFFSLLSSCMCLPDYDQKDNFMEFHQTGDLEFYPDGKIHKNSYYLLYNQKTYADFFDFLKKNEKQSIKLIYLKGKYTSEDENICKKFINIYFDDVIIIKSDGNRTRSL